MPLAGKQLQPRQIAQWGAPHWKNFELVKMVATVLGESAGYVGAYHYNTTEIGNCEVGDQVRNAETLELYTIVFVGSNSVKRMNEQGEVETVPREALVVPTDDLGLMQISVQAKYMGTTVESNLRTESTDAKVYGPIVANNVKAGYDLYEQPGPNNGLRRWQPWVAYTTGWATFPEWWVWHQDGNHKPIGPWMRTGRYVQKAIIGVVNYKLVVTKKITQADALLLGEDYANHFGVKGTLGIDNNGALGWRQIPSKPIDPPADGVGPRPVVNSGL